MELHKAGARFVVLGGHAVAFHGYPRATKDLDILVEANADNARRVYAALAAFGAPLSAFEVGVEDFVSYDGVLQLGVPPRRIDIINRADVITFSEAIADGESFSLEGCRSALIENKRAAGRPQDIADVKALGDG